jgi:hypothetical protein
MSAPQTTARDTTFDRVWRGSGIAFVVTIVIAQLVHGSQPDIGSTPATLVSFYDDDRMRVLIGSSLLALALLNLLWFAAALASTLRDAGQGIWGAAATAASAALATIVYVGISLGAATAYSIAGSGNDALTSGLNDLARVSLVVACFPAAMLVMAGSFGLRQAGQISNGAFLAGVTAVVLLVLGGTTWADHGLWSPDGAYARVIAPVIALVWIAVVSGFLYVTTPGASRPTAVSPSAGVVQDHMV